MRGPTRRGASWDRLRGALWVLPAASVLCSLAAGATLAAVEVGESSWLGPLLFQGTAADARDLLIVVSATMITVTGLVFTLTVVALQIASTQFSPRLLRNFLRDRGNQVVLSIFVSTFAYATAGLHTVGARAGGQGEFVPRLAVSGSLALALLSLGALVYFIHHIARSIQIDTIMAGVERETLAVIDDTYPERFGDAGAEERAPEPPPGAVTVPARRSGYLQAVDLDGLLVVAREHGVALRLVPAVGDHVIAGTRLAWAWPAGGHVDTATLPDRLDHAVQIGLERTMLQDVAFGIRQLADIANKALSPAINDPYTGVQSLQHLSVIIHTLAGRRLGDHLGRDAAGVERVAVPFPSFADYLRLATAQIRRNGAKEPGVARALLRLLEAAGERVTDDPARRADVARHVRLLMADVARETAQPADAEAVLAEGAAVLARLGAGPSGWPRGPGGGIIGVTATTEENQMDDKQLLARIGALVEEEHALERQAADGGDGLDDEEQARLRHLEVQLDQCWDLLRQRRARRDAGLDPEDAQVRPEGTVEGYLQ